MMFVPNAQSYRRWNKKVSRDHTKRDIQQYDQFLLLSGKPFSIRKIFQPKAGAQ
jgi:hypothetical protein